VKSIIQAERDCVAQVLARPARELALDPKDTDVRAGPMGGRCKIVKVAQDEKPLEDAFMAKPLVCFRERDNYGRFWPASADFHTWTAGYPGNPDWAGRREWIRGVSPIRGSCAVPPA
jgi:hypothetical protein